MAQRGRDLVLDTHAWVWAVEGRTDLLNAGALEAIEQAATARTLVVSAMSVWEVAMLVRVGALTLATSVHDWVAESLRHPGARLIPVGTGIALDSTNLPEFTRPRDPADRMIVATARRHGTLLTCDRRLLEWAQAYGQVRALDGRP